MKYKIMVDVSFTDKLDETIHYQPGEIIKTKVDEKRKENIVARGLGHVVEEIDITDKEAKKKAEEAKKLAEEEAAKKLAEEEEAKLNELEAEEEAAKKLAEEEAKKKAEEAKKKASENPTDEK